MQLYRRVLRTAKDDKWIRGYEEITHSKACICGDEFYRVQADCNKLLSRGEHDDLVARKALIEERFPGQFNILFSTPTFLEIMPSGVDKGKGIHRLGELYGITADEIMPSAIPRTIWICSKPPVSPWPWPMLSTK